MLNRGWHATAGCAAMLLLGAHVDVSGCSDPLSELNDAYPPPPPPPPPPAYVPPPPDVDLCASAGRRVSVNGCV